MGDPKQGVLEAVQQMTVRLLATTPAGVNLRLIGGFRYRFLDRGPRISMDIDYHWAGDLQAKRDELVAAFERRLLPEVRRQFGYAGSASPHAGPEGEAPSISVVQLAFWNEGQALSRMELPVEITRISCADDPVVKAMDGVAYPTVSDQDMIESKVIAVFNRSFLQHRDLLDVFLFGNHLAPSSPVRVAGKLAESGIDPGRVRKRLGDLAAGQAYHGRTIGELIDTQVETETAENLTLGGGGEMVLDRVMEVLRMQLADFTGGD